jgi:hypothetical protein
MRALKKSSVVLIAALVAIVGIAYAAPPNSVSSDLSGNTAMGTDALSGVTTGAFNTAAGYQALSTTATADYNTAFGASALTVNTTGFENTATGFRALARNETGTDNTATGAFALANNSLGYNSTATGAFALYNNTFGYYNTATGENALYSNTTGYLNTATGNDALFSNTTGFDNTASGHHALTNNTSGSANTALGADALSNNTKGRNNVAIGRNALVANKTGRNNTAIGWYAGRSTTGNDNVLIAHRGVADESQTMRLGVTGTAGVAGSGITRTYVAGITGVTTGLAGSAVLIDANGQLGTISSSRRYKEDIQVMADASERLQQLRPVKFHYKQPDATGEHPIQYGLIAEEVAEVFPELVVRDAQGQPETVAYHLLPALLLNELQKVQRLNEQQSEQLAMQASQLAEVGDLKRQVEEMKVLLATLQPKNQEMQVARR